MSSLDKRMLSARRFSGRGSRSSPILLSVVPASPFFNGGFANIGSEFDGARTTDADTVGHWPLESGRTPLMVVSPRPSRRRPSAPISRFPRLRCSSSLPSRDFETGGRLTVSIRSRSRVRSSRTRTTMNAIPGPLSRAGLVPAGHIRATLTSSILSRIDRPSHISGEERVAARLSARSEVR